MKKYTINCYRCGGLVTHSIRIKKGLCFDCKVEGVTKRPNNKIPYLRRRFKIFSRDGFTCVYCGRRPPEVILQPDHVIPRSKGGKNTEDNLVTSCEECNKGKGDLLIRFNNKRKNN